MRIKYSFYILFFAFIAFSNQVVAQEVSLNNIQNVKIGSLSDEQITQAWKKLQDSGIPEEDAYKLLIQKGMSPGEVAAFKDRVTLLGLNKKTGTNTSKSSEKKKIDYSRNTNDTVLSPKPVKAITVQPAKTLSVYGTEFFNQTAIKFEPNFSVATPKGYVLGPGDEIIVLLTGLNESSVRSKISPEGNLQIPYAGIVYLNGFTIEQATNLIKSKMTKVYPALSSGQTKLAINLGNTRSIKITIIGEVKTPGSYTLSSLSTLFNVLYNSGGPNQNGSLRNIELIRNNKLYKTVDFYSFLQQGLLDGNVRLEDQDVIRIPVYKKRVSIGGEVKNPAVYELRDN
jgi:protein involved in polysaccharide export with SLBB domain